MLKHGNQYSEIKIKHITQKASRLIRGNITKQALIDKGAFVLLKGTTWQYTGWPKKVSHHQFFKKSY